MAKSQLRQQLEAAAPTGDLGWDRHAAGLELLLTAISGVTLGSSNAAANAGSDASKAISVQGVTSGKAIPVSQKQLAGVPSSFAIQTADQTVFTLAVGEIGFIKVLSADAPLAVKLGASASTTSLNYVLKASTAASDGTGGSLRIDGWVGAVSVAKMAGTSSYLAWKQAA